MRTLHARLCLVVVVIVLAPSPLRADPSCASCHALRVDERLRAPAYAVPDDVHGQSGMTCSDCHGGDPDERSVRAHDLGAGFVGRPDPLATALLCGGCHDGSHEDAPAVLLDYRAGRHAHALAEGRVAATCTSCHGAHGIQRPSGDPASDPPAERASASGELDAGPRDDERDAGADPPAVVSVERALGAGSSATRRAIVAACVQCHSSAETMGASGLPIDQGAQWAGSVHGRAVANGNADAPDCASCHHPHRNEAGLAAVRACGGCHEELRAAFDRGPHAEQFARLGFLDCAECHGNHDVAPASGSMLTGLTAVCTRCHGRGQPAFETVRRIASYAAALDRARAALPPDDPRRRAMIAALHALDPEELSVAIGSAGDLGEPPDDPDEDPAGARRFPWVLSAQVGAILLLALGAAWLFRRSRRLP